MEGFISVKEAKFIMSKDEWRRFKTWVQDKPHARDEQGRMVYPHERVAQFFNMIRKELPETHR